MKRRIASAIVAAIGIFGSGYVTALAADALDPADRVCFEDEPCWDCTTMGNRVCGPVRQTHIDPSASLTDLATMASN